MSLNKFTDLTKKTWMNINCNDMECTTCTADNLVVDDLDVKQLNIDSELIPQINVDNNNAGGLSFIKIKGDEAGIIFENYPLTETGYIKSGNADNKFKISSQGRSGIYLEDKVFIEDQLNIINNLAPQVNITNLSGSSVTALRGDETSISFSNNTFQSTGSISSSDIDNKFKIESQGRTGIYLVDKVIMEDELNVNNILDATNSDITLKKKVIVDNVLNISKQSNGVPTGDRLTLYSNNDNESNNLISEDNNGVKRHLVTTQWVQFNDQILTGAITSTYVSLLKKSGSGSGSLTIYQNSLVNQMYELNFAGTVNIFGPGTSVKIGVYIDNFLVVESDFIGIINQSNESFDGTLYIKCVQDPIPTSNLITTNGHCNFSNIAAPRILSIPLQISSGPKRDIDIDVRLFFAASAVSNDEVRTTKASLKKIY